MSKNISRHKAATLRLQSGNNQPQQNNKSKNIPRIKQHFAYKAETNNISKITCQ